MSEGDLLGSPENSKSPRGRISITTSSPPRSRSQSTGSSHREALQFFERHQLFQQNPEPSHLILLDSDTDLQLGSKSRSFSSSPAHFPENSFGTQCQNQLEGETKSKSLTNKDNIGSITCDPPKNEDTEESLIRNRSIRGRSHSQPSQVLLSTKRESSNGCSDSRTYGKHKYSWLEQIQFRAQYQHYRTNDYSSVVNSANSLDKVGVGGLGHQGQSQRGSQIGEIPQINIHPGSGSSHHSLTGGSPSGYSSTHIHSTNSTKPPLCFNFPRVKLPRIFNAKSLDDILGRSRKTLSSGEDFHIDIPCDDPSSSSVGITTPGITNTTTGITGTSGYFSDASGASGNKSRKSSLISEAVGISFATPVTVINTASVTTTSTTGASGPPQFTSRRTSKPTSENGKEVKDLKEKGRKCSASSNTSTSYVTSTLTSVLLRIPQFGSSSDKKPKRKGKEKPSKSLSSGSLNRVSCANTCANAKSDNYLNRIVASATCARFNVGKLVDNSSALNTSGKTHKRNSQDKGNSPSTRNTTLVESYDKVKSDQETQNQPQQRRWTAVKQKWDLKLQVQEDNSQENGTKTDSTHSQHLLFIKSHLGHISGGGTDTSFPHPHPYNCESDLDSLNTFQDQKVQPHEPGRVSFRLEPEEIPFNSPPISRSQSSDCRPHKIDPELLNFDTQGEEESEDMTRSRHFHYRDNSSRRDNLQEIPNRAMMTGTKSKEKAQLVVANVSYLQRPTSPCRLGADPSSSPIVFNSNNNFPNPHMTMIQQQSTSPISPTTNRNSDESHAAYHNRMKHEYLSGGGSGSRNNYNNINEAGQISGNINKSACGSLFSPCYSYRNDVLEAGGRKTITSGGANPNSSLYGNFGHGDMPFSNSHKDNGGNKNVTLGGCASGLSSSRSQSHSPASGPIDYNQSHRRQKMGEVAQYPGQNRQRYPGGEDDLNSCPSFDSATEEFEDEMGDLQSPTYVKKTVHMFNSRYSSQNGSASSHPEHNGRHNPSYLNVSRIVSGYSCLSYNNGITNGSSVSSTTTINGSPYSQKYVSKSSTKTRSEFPVKVNPTQDARLEKINGRDRVIKSPTKHDDSLDSSYVPSHGKSFIMQRIERLYGSGSDESVVKTPTSTNSTSTPTTTTTGVKDGNYFLNEMNSTANELQRLSDKSSPELESLDDQSERAGNILAAVGKANLLIKKKFKQFEGLCNANLKGALGDEPETTNEDLAGFWDMVMIQVEQVYSLFKEIDESHSESSDAPDTVKASAPVSPRKAVPPTTKSSKPTKSQNSAAAKARDESRRRMLAEKRRLMKEQEQGTTSQEEVLIFSPESN